VTEVFFTCLAPLAYALENRPEIADLILAARQRERGADP
jgi:hypothetical protein